MVEAGGGAAALAVDDDGMQCINHPFRNTYPGGGICAFCLQEKLGKLVSSSSSSSFVPSSSSPSFRSDPPASTSTSASAATLRLTSAASASGVNNRRYQDQQDTFSNYYSRRTRIPFLLTQNKKKNNTCYSDVVLKRSKSTATPRSGRYFLTDKEDLSPRRRGFWSFLHLSSTHKKSERPKVGPGPGPSQEAMETAEAEAVVDEDESSPNSSGTTGGSNTASFERKVSRSRSVGCGSRSFSGDFFERISTGFGDCTLRRVESHREGRRSTSAVCAAARDPMKVRLRCGGLFGGFMITSSSSSSSSSSYWASMADDHGRPSGPLVHGRSRSWGWALASPMRAFGKTTTTSTSTTTTIKEGKNSNSTTSNPNLAAIPSLLAVRG